MLRAIRTNVELPLWPTRVGGLRGPGAVVRLGLFQLLSLLLDPCCPSLSRWPVLCLCQPWFGLRSRPLATPGGHGGDDVCFSAKSRTHGHRDLGVLVGSSLHCTRLPGPECRISESRQTWILHKNSKKQHECQTQSRHGHGCRSSSWTQQLGNACFSLLIRRLVTGEVRSPQ